MKESKECSPSGVGKVPLPGRYEIGSEGGPIKDMSVVICVVMPRPRKDEAKIIK